MARWDLPCVTIRSPWSHPAGDFGNLPFPPPSRPAELIAEASERTGGLPNVVSETVSFDRARNSTQFLFVLYLRSVWGIFPLLQIRREQLHSLPGYLPSPRRERGMWVPFLDAAPGKGEGYSSELGGDASFLGGVRLLEITCPMVHFMARHTG